MEAYYTAAARAEAQRWIGIAEKLLAARDLVGSKSFAIRAQESDPNSEPAAQILAVVDTLFAGEKRINNQHDLYSILQLPPSTHDWELIAANYRRLALLLNPHMNNFPFADQAFRFVLEAWSVLSNHSRKSVYDNEVNFQPTFNNPVEQQLPHNLHQNQIPQPEQVKEQPQFEFRQGQNLNPNPSPRKSAENVTMPQFEVRQSQNPSPRKSAENVTQPQFELRQSQNQNPRKSAENVAQEEEESELNLNDNDDDDDNDNDNDDDDGLLTFWTACPYCYNMYEYPRVYVECCLRCQNCHRAFQAVKVPPPQINFDEKGAVFSCWGFFPLGVPNSEKGKVGGSSWSPFSQIVACPTQVANNAKDGSSKKSTVRRRTGPVVYIDDDQDVFDEISDPGDDDSSDVDWRTSSYKKKKKKAKRAKGKGAVGRPRKQSQGGSAKNVNRGAGGGDVRGGFVVQEGAGVPNVPAVERPETSRKVVGTNSRRQTGRVAKNLGKLDLNVEFSNEVEDPAQGNGGGRREEDNIEGIGFFEGLDEFLSNLPILSVVGDDKVKAA